MESHEKKADSTLWNARSIVLISSFFIASVIDGLLISSLIPMLPMLGATLKLGARTSVLFSISPVVILLVSPLVGGYTTKIGLSRTLFLGLFSTGCSAIILGYSSSFWMAALALGGLGFGGAHFWCGLYMFISLRFSNDTAFLIGILEVATGLGTALGPPYAIWLSSTKDFTFPFLVCGALEFLSAVAMLAIMRTESINTPVSSPDRARSPTASDDSDVQDADSLSETSDMEDSDLEASTSDIESPTLKTTPLTTLAPPIKAFGERSIMEKLSTLKDINCFATLGATFLVQGVCMAIEPHLSSYLSDHLKLSSGMVGIALAGSASGYMAVSPIAGKLSDRLGGVRVLKTGVAVCGLGLLLLVPLPTTLVPSLMVQVVVGLTGLVLLSAAQGLVFVPALPTLISSAKDSDDDRPNAEAAAFLGGVFQSVTHLAGAVGPIGGELLLYFFNFGRVQLLLGIVVLVVAVVLTRLPSSKPEASCSDYEPIPELVTPLETLSVEHENEPESLTASERRPERGAPAAKRVLFPDNLGVDGGEQLYQFGSTMVIGKDVDPG